MKHERQRRKVKTGKKAKEVGVERFEINTAAELQTLLHLLLRSNFAHDICVNGSKQAE